MDGGTDLGHFVTVACVDLVDGDDKPGAARLEAPEKSHAGVLPALREGDTESILCQPAHRLP
ncbi:hypothetical protein ASG92_12965 [Arthrobacter sp. Soil736]|uniref:hypothetical protein n=1 Tax=Arthrobacter sp. Soil736 TaxID=1736395 RepID=UPI000712D5E5|nr:hypothetical protein [Arthrobacter sp. Soil736]KRE44573.1 hypothetical protein ASG92_12965 [Arthrobacter sp. Soil736]